MVDYYLENPKLQTFTTWPATDPIGDPDNQQLIYIHTPSVTVAGTKTGYGCPDAIERA